MPRTYSHRGCNTCKVRKKKCDEGNPRCQNCLRLGLECLPPGQQDSTIARRHQTWTLDTHGSQTQQLREPLFHLPWLKLPSHDLSIISRVPSTMVRFYTPLVNEVGREMDCLMQMILTQDMVCKAVVTCFSAVLPDHNNELGHMDRRAYGQALIGIRGALSKPEIDFVGLSVVQIAMSFIGMLEAAGPNQSPDPATHWIANARVLARIKQLSYGRSSPLSRNLQVLFLEVCLYNMVACASFTHDVPAMSDARRQSDICGSLLKLTGEESHRICLSHLLGGQYELWDLALEITLSARSRPLPTSDGIVSMKLRVQRIEARLDHSVARAGSANASSQRAMLQLYHLHCTALMLVATALEPSSDSRDATITALARHGLQDFRAWELFPMAYSQACWALQVLACAIEEQADWETFNAKLGSVKALLDAGHLRRLEGVVARVEMARTNANASNTLWLLRQPEGILYCRKTYEDDQEHSTRSHR